MLIIDCHSKSQSKNARTFYEDKSVLYVSIHRTDDLDRMDHCRPEDIGRGAGAGFNVNLAWNGKAAVDSEDAFALHHVSDFYACSYHRWFSFSFLGGSTVGLFFRS